MSFTITLSNSHFCPPLRHCWPPFFPSSTWMGDQEPGLLRPKALLVKSKSNIMKMLSCSQFESKSPYILFGFTFICFNNPSDITLQSPVTLDFYYREA